MKYFIYIAALSLLMFSSPAFAEKVWTSFTASDAVYDIAVQGDYVWCATANGPVRWDKRDMSFKKYNGFADNRVSTVAADGNGNVWFGGKADIYRWNGVEWTRYSNIDVLSYNDVSVIKIGPDGMVYSAVSSPRSDFGSYSGRAVYRYDGNTWNELYLYTYMVWDKYHSLAVNGKGNFWVVSDGKPGFHDGESMTQYTSADGLPNESIQFVLIDNKGETWAAANSYICHLTGTGWKNTYLGGLSITAICSGPDSNLVIGVAHNDSLNTRGIALFNGTTWEEIILGQGKEKTVSSLLTGPEGTIYVGTQDGLYSYSSSGWKNFPSPEHLPITQMSDIVKTVIDQSGVFWVFGAEQVMRYDGKDTKLIPIPKTYPKIKILDAKVSNNGWIWLGTNMGVLRYDGSGWVIYEKKDGLLTIFSSFGTGVVSVAFDPEGTPWASTVEALYQLNGKKWNRYTNAFLDSLELKDISSMTFDSNGDVWLCMATPSKFTFVSKDSQISYPVSRHDFASCCSMIFDSNNDLWAILASGDYMGGPMTSSLVRISGSDWFFVHAFSTFYANTMIVAPDNSFWISSRSYMGRGSNEGGGLACVSNGKAVLFSEANGLLENSVASVACSPDGTIWAATPSGFSRYGEPLSDETIITSVSDAVPTPVSMLSNFPNPFNPSTTISFTLPAPGKTSLTIYDITGRKVRTLISGRLTAGAHSAAWDGLDDSGRAVSSGVYLSRLTTGKHTTVGKMLLMK